MLRVGVDCHILTGKFQGSRTYLENIMRQIGELGSPHQWILYSYDPNLTSQLLDYPEFEHQSMPRSSILRLLTWWAWAGVRDQLDVLITQYNGPLIFNGKQMVVIHDLLYESHPQFFPFSMRLRLKLLSRLTALRAAAVFTVSKYSYQEIIRRYKIPPERVHITRNGYSPAKTTYIPDYIPTIPKEKYILCVGRLEPRKNIELVITATKEIRKRGIKLVIVGREDFHASNLLSIINKDPGIVHLRDVSEDHLKMLYANASVFCFPSLCEGFGIPVIEALAQGTPVIASSLTAIPEAGGNLAVYFDPRPLDAAEKLASIIDEVIKSNIKPDLHAVQQHLATLDWSIAAQTIINAVNALEANSNF